MSQHLLTQLLTRNGPMTVPAIAAETRLGSDSVRSSISRGRARFHVTEWRHGLPAWAAGPGEDAPKTSSDAAIANWLQAHGPATAATVAASWPTYTRKAIDAAIIRLRASDRAHIVDWKRQEGVQGRMAGVFKAGPGEDAPKPEVTRRSRARVHP